MGVPMYINPWELCFFGIVVFLGLQVPSAPSIPSLTALVRSSMVGCEHLPL